MQNKKVKSEPDIPVKIKKHRDKNGGHFHVILDDVDNKHVSVGFSTQQKKGQGKKTGNNFTMDRSPFKDGKESYMRRQGTVDRKGSYYGDYAGSLTSKDYKQAKYYGDKAKEKYLKSKKGKKKSNSGQPLARA